MKCQGAGAICQQRTAPLSKEHTDPETKDKEEMEEEAASANAPRNSSGRIGLTTRMHLDPGLIRNIIREVVGVDPFDRYFIGFTLIDNRSGGFDNYQPSSTLMNNAMQVIVEDWYRRYLTPLPYHSTIDGTSVREAMQRASVQAAMIETTMATINDKGTANRALPRRPGFWPIGQWKGIKNRYLHKITD